MKFDFFHGIINDNPYFSAGLGLMGFGVCIASARQALIRLAYLTQKKFLTSLEINSKDPSYYWILKWLTKTTSQRDSSKVLMTGSHFTIHTTSNGFILTPSTGIHYVKWNGKWIKIQRERERSSTTIDLNNSPLFPFEYMKFTCIGNKATWLIEEMIENIEDISKEEKNGKLQIYTHFASEWRPLGSSPQKKRSLSSVILQNNLTEIITSDLKDFLSNEKWYEERGIPYRRGYLLYGPPGCGKSSFVKALASEFGYSISLLNLADSSICDDRLNQLLHALPQGTVLLLEDVDAIMNSNNKGIRLTLSGLLNALDGVAATEERIIFMTTNNHQILPTSLTRPGRVDMALNIDVATREQSVRMFHKFYDNFTNLDEAKEFENAIIKFLPQSPATIQNLFIKFKNKPKNLIEFLNKEGL